MFFLWKKGQKKEGGKVNKKTESGSAEISKKTKKWDKL